MDWLFFIVVIAFIILFIISVLIKTGNQIEKRKRDLELLGQKEALNGQLEQKEKEIQDLQNDKFNNIHLMNYVAQNVQTIDDLDELDSFERNIQHRYRDLVTKTGYQENGKDTYYDTKGYIQEAIENRRSELKGINITEHLENLPPANGDITDNPQGDVVKEDTITDPNLDPNINPNKNPNIEDGDNIDKDIDEVPEGNDTVFETSPELENEITDTIIQKDNNNSNPVNPLENENPSNINDNEDNNKDEFDGPTAFAPKKKTSFAPRKSNFADLPNEQKEKFKSMVQNVLNSIKEQGKKVSFENFIKYIAQVNREQADLQYGLLKQSYEYTTGETINNEEFRDVYNKIFNPVTALLDMGSSVITDEEIDMANLENSEKAVNTPKIVKRSNPTPIVITETNIGDSTLFPNQPDFLAIDYEVNYDEETGEYKAVNKGNTVLKKQEEKGKYIEEEKINFKENYEEFRRVLEDNKIDCFYHFTERSNLDNIKKGGGLFSWNFLKKNNIDSIFGGNELSHQLDRGLGLEDYVRLSFCEKHPMMFVAVNEGRIQDPVILEIDIEVAFLKGTLFSDMNANKTGHKRGGGIEDLKNVKFDVVKKIYGNLEVLDKAYYQAEILVKTKIPIGYIRNINKF